MKTTSHSIRLLGSPRNPVAKQLADNRFRNRVTKNAASVYSRKGRTVREDWRDRIDELHNGL